MSAACKFSVTLFALVILQINLCSRFATGQMKVEDHPIRKLNASERVKNSTKWCLPAAISNTVEDYEFGSAIQTDRCCKRYAECSDLIASGESKFGLLNTGSYARPSCKCAGKFFLCLNYVAAGVDDHEFSIATEVGRKYFGEDGDPCYNLQTSNCANGYYDAMNNRYETNEIDEYFCADWMIIYWHNKRKKSYFQRYVWDARFPR